MPPCSRATRIRRCSDSAGADAAALLDTDGQTVKLATSHRCAPVIARAVSGVGRLLPGLAPARAIAGADGPDGSVAAVLAASAHAEAAVVADTLRRARLVDDVPWSQMAVIVRSVPGQARACRARWLPRVCPWRRRPWTRRCPKTRWCGRC